MRYFMYLPLLCSLLACTGEIGDLDYHGEMEDVEPGSINNTNKKVGDYERSGCSTAHIAPLSRQIAEEMLCASPGVLVELQEGNGLSFRSSAVLPFMEATAGQHLRNAAATRPIQLNSGFRTVVQQYLLRRWWQLGRCGIPAAAKPGRSNHESGRAIDVANRSAVRSTLRNNSWTDPLPGDPVHFEHLSSPDLRGLDVHAFQRLWNRNNPNDKIDEDGNYGSATAARIRASPAAGFPVGANCGVAASANWIGDVCEQNSQCELPTPGRCEAWFNADSNEQQGMCVTTCEGSCPSRSGEMSTFCAVLSGSEGTCVPRADSVSNMCALIPGSVAKPMRRFDVSGGASSTIATVCVPPQTAGIQCSSGTNVGECINTERGSCSNMLVTGACPGPANIRCCLE